MNKLFVSSSILLAQTLSPVVNAETSTDNSIIVTATRTAQTEDETLASVTVITREDIERSQAQSVQELLTGLSGISITNNGGQGKNTSVFIRGTESDHVLVMINGVKVGSATSGDTAFQHIPVDLIDRIEIVRGPRSSLYGAEAIGGVIQIFTRQGKGELKPSFSSTTGSYRTFKNSFGLSYGSDKSWYNLNLSSSSTDGFNSCSGTLSAGCFTVEPDKDGYYQKAAMLSAGYHFSKTTVLEASAMHSEGETQYDGGFVNEAISNNQVITTSLKFSPSTQWAASLSFGQSKDYSDNYKDGVYLTRFNTTRKTVSLQNDISLTDSQILSIGYDTQNDEVESTTAYLVTSRDNKGTFLQYQSSFANSDLQVSARHEDNEQFGGHATGGIAWGYQLDSVRLKLSYATAFKAPTYNELYWPGFGNPDLKPESSESFELGLTGKMGNGSWSLNLHDTTVNELIAFDAAISLPNNISEAKIQGLEFTAHTKSDNWNINTSLTLLSPENRSAGTNYGNTLPRRATESLRFDIDRDIAKWQLGATLNAVGKRYDNLANTVELDAYTTLDLRTTYLINDELKIQASIKNATDEIYETAKYYNQPERSFYLTFSYQPK